MKGVKHCEYCKGEGSVYISIREGSIFKSIPCGHCSGTGHIILYEMKGGE